MRRLFILLLSAFLILGGAAVAAQSLAKPGAIAANLVSQDYDDDDCDKSGSGGDCKTPEAGEADHDDDDDHDRDDDTTPTGQTGGQTGALEIHMAGERGTRLAC